MADKINNGIAEIHVALNQIVRELSRLQIRQLEMSDLLIEARNGDLSLDDVGDMQNSLIKDQGNLVGLIKILAQNSEHSCVDSQYLGKVGNLTRLRTVAKS